MDYILVDIQFLLLQCIQWVPYIALQRGNGGSNPSDLKAYGMPRLKIFRLIQGKIQNCLDLCTHPDVSRFEVKSHVYTRVWV